MRSPGKSGGRPSEADVRSALRALPEERSDPAFRERLKRDFAAGDLSGFAGTAISSPGTSPLRRAMPTRPQISRRAGWLLPPVAAAAALLLVVGLNRGPSWSLLDLKPGGVIQIDGQSFSAADSGEITRHLRGRSAIEVSGQAPLVLRASGVMLLELAPGTRASLPPTPGRWFRRRLECRVEQGDFRILTGPLFPGVHLRAVTQEGAIELTGTLVSIYRDESLTCVCVAEGTAMVGISEHDMEPVTAGHLKAMLADGSKPIHAEIAPGHAGPLREFARIYRQALESGAGRKQDD